VRTTIIGGKKIQLRANPLALLFYKQAFDSDLIADLLKLQSLQSLQDGDFSSLDMVSLFQIAYAMNKAAKPADVFPTFEEWLAQFETIGFDDPQWIVDVVEEAADGFFRSGKSAPESKEQ
jgi:hypothetical protein